MKTTPHTAVPLRVYLLVFAALMVLLCATVAAAFVNLGEMNFGVAMLISAAKTVLIILFFMHVQHGSKLIKLVACVGFAWLAILLLLAMNDYISRRWQKPAGNGQNPPFQNLHASPWSHGIVKTGEHRDSGAVLEPAAPSVSNE